MTREEFLVVLESGKIVVCPDITNEEVAFYAVEKLSDDLAPEYEAVYAGNQLYVDSQPGDEGHPVYRGGSPDGSFDDLWTTADEMFEQLAEMRDDYPMARFRVSDIPRSRL